VGGGLAQRCGDNLDSASPDQNYGTLAFPGEIGRRKITLFKMFRTNKKQLVTCYYLGYNVFVITDFKHKGLEKFFLKGVKSGIQVKHAGRLRLILGRLNASTCPNDMSLPGLFLHELKGRRKHVWAVRVSGNWRVTFRFQGKNAELVDYEDYH